MSHKVTVATQIKDTDALLKVCREQGLTCELAETGKTLTRHFYDGQGEGVAAFRPKDWKYDAVVDAEGSLQYDNYRGDWGRQEDLDVLLQGYSKEVVLRQCLADGLRLEEQTVEQDGTLRLVLVE